MFSKEFKKIFALVILGFIFFATEHSKANLSDALQSSMNDSEQSLKKFQKSISPNIQKKSNKFVRHVIVIDSKREAVNKRPIQRFPSYMDKGLTEEIDSLLESM